MHPVSATKSAMQRVAYRMAQASQRPPHQPSIQRLSPLLPRFLAVAASPLPEHRLLTMPKVSPTMTHGRLIEWKKQEGDPFAEGETLAEVETDKATMPIEAKEDGFFAKILVPADTPDIPLGQLLAVTVEEKDFIPAFANFTHNPQKTSNTTPTQQSTQSSTAAEAEAEATSAAPPSKTVSPIHPPPRAPHTAHLSPAVARILADFPQVDLNLVRPTGPKGNILKGDILAAILDGSAFAIQKSPATTNPTPALDAHTHAHPNSSSPTYTDIPLSSMRRAIARRLTESKHTVPHRYATATYELDNILSLRKRINAADPSPKVSVNDFMILAVAIALRRVPALNAQWSPELMSTVPNPTVDVAFAVALENGLITPIVKNADALGLVAIAHETKRLVALARAGQLKPDDFEGGSFSISNLGMYGVSKFSAIINPPQSGILAVASGIERALVDEGVDGKLRTATVGTATLSADARVVSDEAAGQFLVEFARCLTNPESMLL